MPGYIVLLSVKLDSEKFLREVAIGSKVKAAHELAQHMHSTTPMRARPSVTANISFWQHEFFSEEEKPEHQNVRSEIVRRGLHRKTDRAYLRRVRQEPEGLESGIFEVPTLQPSPAGLLRLLGEEGQGVRGPG